MSIEAMKLALFALDIVKIHYTQNRHINEAIAALKERLADPMREVQRLGQEIEQEPPQRTEQERDEILQAITDPENQPSQFGTVTLEYHQEKMKDAEQSQRTEQNFCPRCGKRTKDMTHIHTCTPPPQENT